MGLSDSPKAWYERSFDGGLCAGWGNYCDIRKSGLCEIAQDVFEKYYLKLADISPVICNNYGYYLRTEKGDSYGGLLRYVEAARRGDPQAAYNAGHIYEAGEEVDENIDLAYQLYEMAAKCGHPAGQFEVDIICLKASVMWSRTTPRLWNGLKRHTKTRNAARPPVRRPPPTSVYAIRRGLEQFKTTMWHSSIFMKPVKTSTIYGSQ